MIYVEYFTVATSKCSFSQFDDSNSLTKFFWEWNVILCRTKRVTVTINNVILLSWYYLLVSNMLFLQSLIILLVSNNQHQHTLNQSNDVFSRCFVSWHLELSSISHRPRHLSYFSEMMNPSLTLVFLKSFNNETWKTLWDSWGSVWQVRFDWYMLCLSTGWTIVYGP